MKRIDVIAVVFIAAIVAIVWAARHPDVIDDDSPDYIIAAENLAEGRGMLSKPSPDAPPAWRFEPRVAITRLSELQGDVEATRTPGYPLFLALLRLLGLTPRGATFVQHALHVALIGALVMFAQRIGAGRGAAIAAGLWLIVEPYGRWAANHVVSETLFAAAVFAIVWLTARGPLVRSRSTSGRTTEVGSPDEDVRRLRTGGPRALLLGILCAAATFIRPIAILFCFPVALFGVRRVGAALLLIACALTPPALWAVRNQRQTGIFTFSLIVPINRLWYTAAGAQAATMPGRFADNLELVRAEERTRLDAMIHQHPMTPKEKLDAVNALANDILRHHVRGAVLHAAHDLRAMFFLTYRCDHCGTSKNRAKDALLAFNVAFFVLAVVGLITFPDKRVALILAITIVYFFCIGVGSGGGWGRFRVPAEPFYALAAAMGAQRLIRRRA